MHQNAHKIDAAAYQWSLVQGDILKMISKWEKGTDDLVLKRHDWSEMGNVFFFWWTDTVRLTFDPNTAYKELALSNGNRRVMRKRIALFYPEHPERFDGFCQVFILDFLQSLYIPLSFIPVCSRLFFFCCCGDRCWKSPSLIILHKSLPQTTIFCSSLLWRQLESTVFY